MAVLNQKRKILVLYAIAVLAILLIVLNKSSENKSIKQLKILELAKKEFGQLYTTAKKASNFASSLQNDSLWLAKFQKNYPNWNYINFTSNRAQRWTSNVWLPNHKQRDTNGRQLFKTRNGWVLAYINKGNLGTSIVYKYIYQHGKGYFNEQIDIKAFKGIDLELSTNENSFPIGYGNVYVYFYRDLGADRWTNFALYLFGFCIIIGLLLAWYHDPKWYLSGVLILCSVRVLLFFKWIKPALLLSPIFSPEIFAGSHFIPSLGDVLLHLICYLAILLGIYLVLKKKPKINLWTSIIIVWFCAIQFLFAFQLTKTLILNSKIAFDITKLSSINIYSFICLLVIASIYWSVFRVLKIAIYNFRWNVKKELILIIGFSILAYFLGNLLPFGIIDFLLALIISLGSILIVLACYNQPKVVSYMYFTLLFSLINSYYIVDTDQNRMHEYLKFFSSKILTNKDLEAEYLFAQMENTLVEEFLKPEDFSSFVARKDQFEKRLRRLYFSGYLDKYDLKILSFDSLGNNINSSTLYNFKDLNQIYSYQSYPTLSNHFYQVKSDHIINGYLSKFENCNLEGHFGSIFILLEPKFIQSSYSYPQLTSKAKKSSLFDIDEYAYGIYSSGRLIHQKGAFTYPFNIPKDSFQSSTSTNSATYHHFISTQPDEIVVVLSHQKNVLLKSISTVTFSFSFLASLLILFFITYLIFHYLIIKPFIISPEDDNKRNSLRMEFFGLENFLLSTRIRLSMLTLVLLGLLISVYVTIQFISVNNKQLIEADLINKTKEIANQVQNEVDIGRKLANKEQRQLIVNEIADLYKVEANLYNPDGFLLASSVEDFYKEQLLAPLMHPLALTKMREFGESQVVHNEHIRNFSYTSSYLPLLNDRRDLIAFLNIPYYKTNSVFDRQVSVYVVTFINIYFLLFLLTFVVANFVAKRISKPLQLIRKKMGETILGNQIELIEWKGNDEIGQLVKQYNKMVLELESSTEKLTASEREGAWKEMAKQVAHEIKNPLTPMKLNIQHLQRAWHMGSDKLDSTFKRVTKVLIEQIDSLSKLASEFSSFAQMPKTKEEYIVVADVLLSTIHLFEKSENMNFNYKTSWEKVTTLIDKNQLGRIFNNVIKNAVQSIPESQKGEISIYLKLIKHKILVTITDNGRGISKDEKAKIFVPNFSTKTSGMGLGLAMTKKMVLGAKGKITFDSEVSKGTSFFIEFPLLIDSNI